MMIEDNILLITDNDNVAENLISKLVLLRKSDSIAVCNFTNAEDILKSSSISIVIVHERGSEAETLEFIKSIISDKYDVILLLDKENQNLILSAYDLGVVDYYTIGAPDYEIFIKTVNTFKRRTLKVKSLRDNALLKYLNAVDGSTGFYKYKFCKDLFIEFIKESRVRNGMFAILTVDESSKKLFSVGKLSTAIKDVVRGDDIVSMVQGGKFYILLPDMDKSGAYSVISKIQDILLAQNIIIRAGICEIRNKNLEILEKEAFMALTEAINKCETVVYFESADVCDDWLEPDETNEKHYKIFQNTYKNKVEKVITPVFFRFQKTYEGKLFETDIVQYTKNDLSLFRLKNETNESRLKIIYSGFAKVVVLTEHSGLDTPESKEFSLGLNEITHQKVTEILDDFIAEFKATMKK